MILRIILLSLSLTQAKQSSLPYRPGYIGCGKYKIVGFVGSGLITEKKIEYRIEINRGTNDALKIQVSSGEEKLAGLMGRSVEVEADWERSDKSAETFRVISVKPIFQDTSFWFRTSISQTEKFKCQNSSKNL